MSNVVRLYTPNELDRLWEEYAALARATAADIRLLSDRRHIEAMARAERRFRTAYLASENAA